MRDNRCDAMAYTHGTQIYIDADALVKINEQGEQSMKRLDYILAHELFHCITRCNRDFRSGQRFGSIRDFNKRDDLRGQKKRPSRVHE